MDRDQTFSLWNRGITAWNEWAKNKLLEKDRIIANGNWENTVEKEKWEEESTALFSDENRIFTFSKFLDLSNFIFPHNAKFRHAIFLENISFRSAVFYGDANFYFSEFRKEVSFTDTVFHENAYFTYAKFSNFTSIIRANFSSRAVFLHAQFDRGANFSDTKFGLANFRDAFFVGEVTLKKAEFLNEANFSGSRFGNSASFEESIFYKNVDFHAVNFESYVNFSNSVFNGDTDFGGAHADRGFSLLNTTFAFAPNFIQTHFAEAPALDNLKILNEQGSASTPERYRALRRLAVQGHDHENEMNFFAHEFRSARGVKHFPFGKKGYVLSWWLGFIYQIFSNFGRSVLRPVFCLLLITITSSYFYLLLSDAPSNACFNFDEIRFVPDIISNHPYENPSSKAAVVLSGLSAPVRAQTSPLIESVHLAMHNALFLLDSDSDAMLRTYGCLYGLERYGDNPVPYVPSKVTFLSGLQKLLSGTFLFLIGLGLRNALRMK